MFRRRGAAVHKKAYFEDMAPIPFSLPDDGLTERKGTVRLGDEYLVLHIQTALMGEFNKRENIIKIEPSAIEDAELKKGLFRDVLYLIPKREDLFEAMPGVQLGAVGLKIWRKHRSRVEDLIEEIERRIVGF